MVESRTTEIPHRELQETHPQPDGVSQKGVGDCFFLAALASLANSTQGQDQIRGMIKTNADGSFTVTFPGDASSPVAVSQDDIEENKDRGNIGNNADWADVIETAFLKYDHIAQYGAGGLNSVQYLGIPILGNVTSSAKALHLLTAKDVSTDSIGLVNFDNTELTRGNTSKKNIADAIQTSLANGEPVTAMAALDLLRLIGENSSGPMYDGHLYSVLAYDPKTETVTVRNPWGHNNDTELQKMGATVDGITNIGGGKLQMSMDTFVQFFNDINFAGKNPYANSVQNYANDARTQAATVLDLGSDILDGKFRDLPGDAVNVARDSLQVSSDLLYGLTDSTERTAKIVLAKAVETAGDIIDILNPFD